ncbi:LytR/AlgR family response regulator transcription factor [Sediminicola arcticus]|jgi:two-component system LytT family response regulator|uniref:LytTR family DNA-binding domain-containing protein n=1 Tax=Sediminicola arcticus TaxID=1574308 RepID=A0ABV2SUM7_9FLAO
MQLKSIIIDDSTMQRLAVAKLIKNHPQLILLAEYCNAMEANKGIKELEVDLIFLDIEMPIINGFDLLESLNRRPQIILITGKKDYAFKAFEYGVTDYLHKPITQSRFKASIDRAINNYKLIHGNEEDKEFFFVKTNLKKRKIFMDDIEWIEALGDYIKLITKERNVIVLSTMKAFDEKLPKDKFLRIHKSYIVNLEKIERFNSKIVEVHGRELPISRHKRPRLEKVLKNL